MSRPTLIGFIACAQLVLGLAVAAIAQVYQPETIYYNETIQKETIDIISHMSEAELRLFAQYLAECQHETVAVSQPCSVAASTYRMEFGADRAVDKLMTARGTLAALSSSRNKLDTLDAKTLADGAIREAKIYTAMQGAVQARFRALRAEKK
jgi:hypothetical protein